MCCCSGRTSAPLLAEGSCCRVGALPSGERGGDRGGPSGEPTGDCGGGGGASPAGAAAAAAGDCCGDQGCGPAVGGRKTRCGSSEDQSTSASTGVVAARPRLRWRSGVVSPPAFGVARRCSLCPLQAPPVGEAGAMRTCCGVPTAPLGLPWGRGPPPLLLQAVGDCTSTTAVGEAAVGEAQVATKPSASGRRCCLRIGRTAAAATWAAAAAAGPGSSAADISGCCTPLWRCRHHGRGPHSRHHGRSACFKSCSLLLP